MGKTVTAIVGIVAAVAIAIVAPMLAPVALGFLGITATATAIAVATAVIGVALSIGLSLAFRALGVGAPSSKAAVGPPQVFRQSIANSFIVYGKRRVGGLLAFFHPRQDGDDYYRYFVIAVAGHRCQGVVTWMLGDEEVTVSSNAVTSGKYAGAAWLWFQRGLASETANATFVSECGGKWTSAHKGNGVAAIYAKFKMTDAVVQAGMPNITAIIEGRDEIADPRASTGYTANGPLVFYDWMQIPREEGGFGAYADEVPDDAWISAQANVADETVSSENRYELHGVIQTGAPPNEIRDVMIVNMGGSYTYTGGKHLMRPGCWVPSTATLSEDDLAGAIQVSPFFTADATSNEVQGTFVNPADKFQGAAFATQRLAVEPTDIRQVDLDLAFTTSPYQAERIARIMLNRAQCEKTVVWPMNISGLKVRALDTVQLASTRYGLDNYAFQVSSWGMSADFGVVLSLREENADIYDDPTPTTPTTPPVIDHADHIRTTAEIQTILRGTYPSGMNVDAIDAGATASVRLYGATTADTFTLDYPGLSDLTVGPISITGLSFATDYYPYVDVNSGTLVPSSWAATTVYGDSLNSTAHPYRISLGRKVTTPVDGGTTTTGGGLGGSYGGGGTGYGGSYPTP